MCRSTIYYNFAGDALQPITRDITLTARWDCDVYVRLNRVTSDNWNDILGDGSVSYNPDTNVLTLNNASFSTVYNKKFDRWGLIGPMHNGILIGGNLTDCTINVLGTNNITTAKEANVEGIAFEGGTLTFTGTGTLTIDTTECSGGNDYAISLYKYQANSTLIIDGPDIIAIAKDEIYGGD